eukprot:5796934-Pleurochrysis_carterae.AAC.5
MPQNKTNAKGVPCSDHRHMRARASGRRGGGSNSGVKARSMPANSARAALCCAGAEPAACGIAGLEYGNPLDLRVISTHI